MHKILVTGANGQLGNEIRSLAATYPEYEFSFTDIDELDITDISKLKNYCNQLKPSFIINCAAYNNVDKAEKEYSIALKINEEAVKNLALVANDIDAFLIHISTDFVFNGNKNTPYTETDDAEPLSKYADSKHKGELALIANANKGAVIRTSWLYSSFGHNFIKTIIKQARAKDELKVVYDQIGTPTYAGDLAEVILEMTKKAHHLKTVEIFHFSDEGVASWYDFASAIVEINEIECTIKAVRTEEYPLPAKRPYYSIMDKSKIKKFLNIRIPHWITSLEYCIAEINND